MHASASSNRLKEIPAAHHQEYQKHQVLKPKGGVAQIILKKD
jgi:hypothetical protein